MELESRSLYEGSYDVPLGSIGSRITGSIFKIFLGVWEVPPALARSPFPNCPLHRRQKLNPSYINEQLTR